MAGEPIDTFSIEISAEVSEFIADVQTAFEEVEDAAEKTANQIQGAFVSKLAGAFKGDLLPEVEESLRRIGGLMQSMDIDLGGAAKIDLEQLEEAGLGFGGTVDMMVNEVDRLRKVLDTDVVKATDKAVRSLQKLGKTISPEVTAKIREQAEKLRLASADTQKFESKMDKLVNTLKRSARAAKRSGSAAAKLGKRMVIALGATVLLQKAMRALTTFLRESAEAFREAADPMSDVIANMDRMEKQTKDLEETVGAFTIVGVNMWQRIALAAKQVVGSIIALIPSLLKGLAPWAGFFFGLQSTINAIRSNFFTLVLDFGKVIAALVSGDLSRIKEAVADAFDFSDLKSPIEEFANGYATAFDLINGAGQKLEDEIKENLEALGSEAERSARRLLVALLALDEEIGKRVDRLEQRFKDRAEDIGTNLARDIADAAKDLSRDLAEIDADSHKDALGAQDDYNVDRQRLEEDHKRAMVDLENDFLFNLEDAVRQRDARGVLMLQRRFNKEKAELDANKNVRTKRLKQDFQLELREIERERLLRREDRKLEQAQELEDLALQTERKRLDLETNRERDLRDLEHWKSLEVKEIAEAEGKKLQLTADGLTFLGTMLEDAFGNDGWAIAFIDNYVAAFNGITGPSGSTFTGTGATPMAQGGSFLATKPQLLLVGEGALPEQVDVTPMSGGRPAAGLPGGAGGGGGAEQHTVDIALEPGLEGSIRDGALDDVARVLMTIQKKAK